MCNHGDQQLVSTIRIKYLNFEFRVAAVSELKQAFLYPEEHMVLAEEGSPGTQSWQNEQSIYCIAVYEHTSAN